MGVVAAFGGIVALICYVVFDVFDDAMEDRARRIRQGLPASGRPPRQRARRSGRSSASVAPPRLRSPRFSRVADRLFVSVMSGGGAAILIAVISEITGLGM